MTLPQIDILERNKKYVLFVELDKSTPNVTHDLFWSRDEQWSTAFGSAMEFDNEIEAAKYIESHLAYLRIMV